MKTGRPYGAEELHAIAPLWDAGKSTSEIGQLLDIPKNSICRIVQLARQRGDTRFPVRGLRFKPKGYSPAVNLMKRDRRAVPRPSPPPPRAVSEEFSVPDFIFQPASFRRGSEIDPDPRPFIYELTSRQCRYPLTSGDTHAHRFCAKPRQPGSAYCPAHKTLCCGASRNSFPASVPA